MALAKISLKLGKKTIELTPEQFEELKKDMRKLDKDYHYYWFGNYDYRYRQIARLPLPEQWYGSTIKDVQMNTDKKFTYSGSTITCSS